MNARRRQLRWWHSAAIAFLCLVVLVGATCVFFTWRGRTAIDEEIAAVRAAGFATSLTELAARRRGDRDPDALGSWLAAEVALQEALSGSSVAQVEKLSRRDPSRFDRVRAVVEDCVARGAKVEVDPGAPIPTVHAVLALGDIFAASAEASRTRESPIDALRDVRSLFGLARSLGPSYSMLLQAARMTLIDRASDELLRLLPQLDDFEAASDVLLDDGRGALRAGLEGELARLVEFAENGGDMDQAFALTDGPGLSRELLAPLWRSDFARVIRWRREDCRAASGPYPQAKKALDAAWKSHGEELAVFSHDFAMRWSHLIEKEARVVAKVALVRLAIRLLAVDRAFEGDDLSLESVAPDVRKDPLGDGDFILERHGAEWSLRSGIDGTIVYPLPAPRSGIAE